jgi:hypothetical protein
MTPSEELVFDLCSRSFLSLWSYANPRRPDGRELCDVLLVFGKRVVVFSVKEVLLNEQADPDVAAKRWIREAVDGSVAQLRGAQREMTQMNRIIRHDGSDGVDLPPIESRRVHLVAVAAGGKRSVPFVGGGKDGRGYVHVMEEEALREILGELDTTADFLDYLEAKESFSGAIICEGEENLLGLYIHAGRKLPTELDALMAEDGIWNKVRSKPEFLARKEEDRISYWWDKLIETFIDDYEMGLEGGPTSSDHERVVRTLAAENRFARRVLSAGCLDWLHRKQAGARNLKSPSGVGYVFGAFPRNWERGYRVAELSARCLVARGPSVMDCPTVVGLGTEVYDPAGYSFDAVYLHMPKWTAQDEEVAQEARKRFGILQEPIVRHMPMDEFPLRAHGPKTRVARNREKRGRRERR